MVSTVFFALYAVFIAIVFLSKSKKQALSFNTLACIACAVYLQIETGYAGTVACIACALGSMFQLYVMQYLQHMNPAKLMRIKLGGCAVFAAVGIAAVYQGPSDLYLIIAIIACRGGEILPKDHQVKLGYTFAEALWLLYAVDKGFLPLFGTHLAMTTLGTIVLFHHYAKTIEEWKEALRMEILFLTNRPALARIKP